MRYSPEEWFTNLGRYPEGLLNYELDRKVNSHIPEGLFREEVSQPMWDLEVGCLLDLNGQFNKPNLTFRPFYPNALSSLDDNQKDKHMKLRWDRLFESLLSFKE